MAHRSGNFPIEREQSEACFDYAEHEQARAKLKRICKNEKRDIKYGNNSIKCT